MKHDHLELCLLFDFYGEMLTDKQRERVVGCPIKYTDLQHLKAA